VSDGKSFWSSLSGVLTALAGVIGAVGTLVGALYTAGIIGQRANAPAVSARATTQGEKAATASPVPEVPASMRLRSTPERLTNEMVDAMLVKHGFYDKQRNTGGKGLVHLYAPHVIGEAIVVVDRATGLMWQKGGSGPLTFSAAEANVAGLNAERFGGFGNWRLPTLEEAASLMEPQPLDGVHVDPVFQRSESIIWTADHATDGRRWVLYFHDGTLAAENPNFNAWVRAVR
jgi:hypothetical protein